MKVAIVYDWMDKWGGVERLLLVLHEIFPKADFYTSFYDPSNAKWAKGLRIHTSFMQKLPGFVKKNRILSLPFFPFAFGSFEFTDYDLVISVTSSFAKGIEVKPPTRHICILLTPTRFLWSHQYEYIKNQFLRKLSSPLVALFKRWDLRASKKPTRIVAISKHVAKRVKKYYSRSSELIYPPFDTTYWSKLKLKTTLRQAQGKKTKDYYLVVSRLEGYKKIDFVINVFNRLNIPLIVIGKGSEERALKRIANKNITFLQNLNDLQLTHYYMHADALIMAQDEDFGYTALEAQYLGCPVITYRKSGARETIMEHKTGILFDEKSENTLTRTIERFEALKYNVKSLTKRFGSKHVKKHFDKKIFKKRILEVISKI